MKRDAEDEVTRAVVMSVVVCVDLFMRCDS